MSFSVLLTHIAHSITKVSRILRWRRTLVEQVGKEHVGGITEYAPLNIVFTSRAFHPPSAFIDDRFQFVGASIDPTRIDTAQSIHIDPTQKNVYISLGTINNLNLDFYRTAFATFKDYPANFILSVGEHTNINQLPPVPDNFMLYPRVPQVQVLQKVDAFITHGGMNSVHEGLYYGVPQVVEPQQMEKLVNAKRVHEV
ncbi:MAG: nucleotide disphospho-sugar-binding domain-containing protein, partial [Chloroflexota bacterium]